MGLLWMERKKTFSVFWPVWADSFSEPCIHQHVVCGVSPEISPNPGLRLAHENGEIFG
jgi:hypothetical protein